MPSRLGSDISLMLQKSCTSWESTNIGYSLLFIHHSSRKPCSWKKEEQNKKQRWHELWNTADGLEWDSYHGFIMLYPQYDLVVFHPPGMTTRSPGAVWSAFKKKRYTVPSRWNNLQMQGKKHAPPITKNNNNGPVVFPGIRDFSTLGVSGSKSSTSRPVHQIRSRQMHRSTCPMASIGSYIHL